MTTTPPATREQTGGLAEPAATEVVGDDAVALAARIRALHRPGHRVMIGVVGAPGSGKSTLSAAVLTQLGGGDPPLPAALVAMDGYHLAQQVLDERGLAEVKGAPETFDAAGYVALLERLARSRPGAGGGDVVYAPEFRRALEEPIAGAVPVPPDVEVVVTEGNYLLVDVPPWNRVRELLTQVWYLDVPDALRVDRLVSRHIAFGRTPEAALARATTGTDGRNAAVVAGTRARADLLIRPRSPEHH